jgi:nucleotide-binding universal stress UspA family protein
MGRHGRAGVGEYLFGTVTERVLRNVEVPVLTITNGPIQTKTGSTYENVLLTTDGSEVAERAAPYGADLAQRTGATVHLLSVVDVQAAAGPFDAGGVSREYVERLERKSRDALDRLVEQIDGEDTDLQSTVAKGTPSTEIATYADDNDIDLLILASEGQTNLVGQHLGSVTRRVLRTVRRPILVIPTPD